MNGAAPAELLKAADKGDLTALASALAAGADVNSSRDRCGNAAQYHLSFAEAPPLHLPLWRVSLCSHPPLSPVRSAGNTALHLATLRGNREVAEVLCGRGADANAVNRGGSRPLHLAARTGDAEIVELLLARGAELNALTSTKCTALHKASQNNHLAAARVLLAAGADISVLNTDRQTASDVAGNMSMRVLLKSALRPVSIVSSAAAVQGAAAWGSPDARVSFSAEP